MKKGKAVPKIHVTRNDPNQNAQVAPPGGVTTELGTPIVTINGITGWDDNKKYNPFDGSEVQYSKPTANSRLPN